MPTTPNNAVEADDRSINEAPDFTSDDAFRKINSVLDRIENESGAGTELVSIAHPAGKSIQQLRTRLKREYAQAENIKTDTTRKHVQKAIRAALDATQVYDQTPDTGLAIYAGIINDDLSVHVFDDTVLPAPITDSLYECSNTFNTDPVRQVTGTQTTYGLVIVERGAAAIGEKKGDAIVLHHEFSSHVMGKSRAGGQSAQRFARDRERQLHEFFTEVGDAATTAFLDEDTVSVDGIAVGGTLGTAKQFVNGSYLDHRLADHILGVYSVEYATERGLSQIATVAEDQFTAQETSDAREVMDTFFTALATDIDSVTYGVDEVRTAAEYGAVDVLLVSEEIDMSGIDDVIRVVEEYGGSVVTVPVTVDRGDVFASTFTGVGALLRFPMQ